MKELQKYDSTITRSFLAYDQIRAVVYESIYVYIERKLYKEIRKDMEKNAVLDLRLQCTYLFVTKEITYFQCILFIYFQ